MDENFNQAIGIAGAGFAALGSSLGAQLNYKNSRKLMDHQNELNRVNAEWQNQVNIQNWQMQNEYNSPANQMQRLRDAGLNPALLYGNGTTSTGTASSPQAAADVKSVNPPAVDFGSMGMVDAVNAYNASRQAQSAIDVNSAQVDYIEANAQLARQKALNLNTQNLQDLFNYQLDDDTREYLIAKRYLENERLSADVAGINQGINESESRIAQNNANIELIKARVGLTNNQAKAVLENLRLVEPQMMALMAKAAKDNSEAKFNNMTMQERANAISQSIAESMVRARSGALQIDRAKFEYNIEKNTGVRFGQKYGIDGLFDRFFGQLSALGVF